ncbi:MAG: hypothetical protein AVDCRST_MAG93-4331, partial [uncultured Chloroflexia bacterium]
RIIFWTLRFHAHLFFTEIFFDLHDVYMDDNCWTMVESLNIDFAPPQGGG